MSGWQPIATAPEDGSQVLLYEPFEPATQAGYFDAADGEWKRSSGDPQFWRQPIHWMPLPEPPQ